VRKVLINIGICFIFVFFISVKIFAQCEGDLNRDRDVDGGNAAAFNADFGRPDCTTGPPCLGDIHPIGDPDGVVNEMDLGVFAADFGRTDCPLRVPLNLFNIGNSIGEGVAAYDDIGAIHHEAVWSTGYDSGDSVYTLNERFEDVDPTGYYENDATRDAIFNHAVEGDEMEDFIAQAIAVVAAADDTPSRTVGMVTVFLGNNDVCTDEVGTMTDLGLFEEQYRAGLEVLATSAVMKNAVIHVSGIPDIYWLWIAKRDSFWCRVFVWPNVPCRELLESPANDCGSGNSDLDPDTIHPDDGPNCKRRKEFHAAIRDDYNRILRNVLQEYKDSGLLPNAYYIDIFDIQFESIHVNGGDCFHPSTEGHALLAQEQWSRSPWGTTDPTCRGRLTTPWILLLLLDDEKH
jgi:lysophospholipase L1-like esterase